MKDWLQHYSHWCQEFFLNNGMNSDLATILNVLIVGSLFFSIILFLDFLSKKIIIRLFKIFSDSTKSTFDDFLVVSNFPKYIAHCFPILLTWYFVPILFKDFPITSNFLLKIVDLYIIFLIIFIVRSILKSVKYS